jgi:hypothetical protein
MQGTCGIALALCLQIVAANDDKTKCPGNGRPPKRHDRLTRLAAHYNGERCKAAILAEDLPRWIANNAGPKTLSNGVEVVAVSSLSSCSIAYIRNPKSGSDAITRGFFDLLPGEYAPRKTRRDRKGNLLIDAPGKGAYDRKPFRWTMVRDPIRRALSAYGQIYTPQHKTQGIWAFQNAETLRAVWKSISGARRHRRDVVSVVRLFDGVKFLGHRRSPNSLVDFHTG